MKRPAFLSGFLLMLVGLGLTIAVMFVLQFHKDAAAPCFYLVRMTAVLGFASALAGVMLQFSSAGLAAGIQLMNMLLGMSSRSPPPSSSARAPSRTRPAPRPPRPSS